jgi:hypothetical protein
MKALLDRKEGKGGDKAMTLRRARVVRRAVGALALAAAAILALRLASRAGGPREMPVAAPLPDAGASPPPAADAGEAGAAPRP